MSLADLLADAGLCGRGGAAFSTATKVAAAENTRAALIVNACDGELGSAKDAWVVATHLDALVAGARLLSDRARPVTYAAHRGSDTLERLRWAGLPVLPVPKRYVSSEESALVSLLHDGLARPMTKRVPFIYGGRDDRGRRIPPTLVLNAETVWRVAQIADHGAAWFRSQGTLDEPGPRLVSVVGHVARPGIVETAAGVRLTDLVAAAGPRSDGVGPPAPAGAVLVGGLGGSFLTAAEASRVRYAGADLRAYGASVGPGVVELLDPVACPVELVDRLLAYAAGESSGQCGPCMFGVPAVASDWTLLRAGEGASLGRLRRRLGLLPGRGACRFPDGIGGLVASALRVFAEDVDAHLAGDCVAHHGLEQPHHGLEQPRLPTWREQRHDRAS